MDFYHWQRYDNTDVLHDKVITFAEERNFKVKKRDSSKLSQEEITRRNINPNLKYKMMLYNCDHGGVYKPSKTSAAGHGGLPLKNKRFFFLLNIYLFQNLLYFQK